MSERRWQFPAGTDAPAPLDEQARAAAQAELAALATPPGALGRLGELAGWWAAVRGEATPAPPEPVELHVIAGDHGVTARGVSAYPASVTPIMVRAVSDGSAAVCALARQHGVRVHVHDLAVAGPWDAQGRAGLEQLVPPAVVAEKVRRASGSLDSADALTPTELTAALAAGGRIADAAVDRGAVLLVLGDLGIGNTTAAAAVVAGLLGLAATDVTGRGTGVDDAGLARKRQAVAAALARVRGTGGGQHGDPDPSPASSGAGAGAGAGATLPALEALGRLAGADLAAMAGVCLRAAARRTPVLLDGVVTTAAALAAERAAPGVARWLVAGHRSTEPAHALSLRALALDPLLTLGMRLGEGSGALAALPLLRSAAALLRDTARLDDLLGGAPHGATTTSTD